MTSGLLTRNGLVHLRELEEAHREILAVEDDIRLHLPAVSCGERLPRRVVGKGGGAHLLHRHRRAAADDMRTIEIAVRGDELLRRQTGRTLERVDVLRVAAAQQAVAVQQADERVGGRRREVARPQALAQPAERLRVLGVEAEVPS